MNNYKAGALLRNLVISIKDDGKVDGDFYPKTLEPSYYSWPSKSDVDSFKKDGGVLIGFKGMLAYASWIFGFSQELTDNL